VIIRLNQTAFGSPGHIVDTCLMTRQHRRVEDVPLAGGRMTSGIVRRGDRLLRPMGPWSPAVHEYLRQLEAAGFEGSPRVLGIEGAREGLTFIDGDVAVDPQWEPGHGHRLPPYARTDLALRGAAALLRQLHAAASGFQPAITSYRFRPRPPRAGEIISHGDLGPWNTVYRDGLPVAFIDWDSAGPVSPLDDLADAAWTFVPLAPPRQLIEAGFDPLPDLPARLRMFVDAYGLTARKAILPALERSMTGAAGRPTNAVDAASLQWLRDASMRFAGAL
jgi:Phosphotransferase enzyme family